MFGNGHFPSKFENPQPRDCGESHSSLANHVTQY